jgi:hypothetical protein
MLRTGMTVAEFDNEWEIVKWRCGVEGCMLANASRVLLFVSVERN